MSVQRSDLTPRKAGLLTCAARSESLLRQANVELEPRRR
jgi:hypothetical protein